MFDKFYENYQRFFGWFACLSSLLLFLLRYHYGWELYRAGFNKFKNVEGMTAFFTNLGIPLPELNVYAVAGFEMIGGMLIVVGLGSRLMALPLTVIMCTAMWTAHFGGIQAAFPSFNPASWSLGPLAAEAPFHYIVMLLLVLILGPGRISLDYLLCRFLGKSE